MFKRKARAGEYVRVNVEHMEVSVRDNFEFILELREKLEKRWIWGWYDGKFEGWIWGWYDGYAKDVKDLIQIFAQT